MYQRKTIVVIMFIVLTFSCRGHVLAAELRLSVAASMTDVFKDLIEDFSRTYPDVLVLPNFGSSGGLARQIHLGAPADLYISANSKWMDFLIKEKEIDSATKKTFASNRLVFIGSKPKQVASLDELINLQRIGMGSPKSVPAGQYAQQALSKAGIYDQLLAAGKLVMAKDVRQALIYADRGETDGSFVYRTDALLAKRAVIFFEVPQQFYANIKYPVALTFAGADKPCAQNFYKYIFTSSAAAIVKKYGFVVAE